MEQQPHSELIAEEFQDRAGSNLTIPNPYWPRFDAFELRYTVPNKQLVAVWRRHNESSHAGRTEDRSFQIHAAATAHNHVDRRLWPIKRFVAISRILFATFGVHIFSGPYVSRSSLQKRPVPTITASA